jgi:nitrogen-specific signal transduction histidine kinase
VQARQSRGGRLQIVIRDNGPGVLAGLERQIFLPFFSAREGGHGIGLTVVRQLMYGIGVTSVTSVTCDPWSEVRHSC